ncbi:hypothetical protein PO909_027291 [Leuciscus waleckii]
MTIIIISLLLLASLLPHLTFTAHVNVGIVDGTEARPNSRPYMVSLQTNGQHICGGFLLSDEFVLTAAQCRNGYEILVVVGAHDLRHIKSSDVIRVKSYMSHPDYIPSTFQNDIMLLRLEKKVELNHNVRRISLPKNGEDVEAGTLCNVAGWGAMTTGPQSYRLMEAFTTTKNQTDCHRRWKSKFFPSQMICAYGSGGSCKGDSGGPLVCGNTAVGVTSFSDPLNCNYSERPNVYTKISPFIQWIEEQMTC